MSLTGAGRALQRQVGRRHARSVARVLTAALDRSDLRRLETIGRTLAGQPRAFNENDDENEDISS